MSRTIRSERSEQHAIVAQLRALGCAVYVTSTNRTAKITPGIPDLYVLHPKLGGFWIEVKRAGGILRPEQSLFKVQCELASIVHVCGGLAQVETYLRERGLVP